MPDTPCPRSVLDSAVLRCREQLDAAAATQSRPSFLRLDQRTALLKAADILRANGRMEDALAVVMRLLLEPPVEPKMLSVGARCAQALGRFREASGLYAARLLMEADATDLFRRGECLRAAGEHERALRAFEDAFDLARGNDELRDLQDRCTAAAAELRAGP